MHNSKLKGMVGMVSKPDALIKAAETVRDAGYKKWDCHTPYPVHGLDDAMGLKESFLPFIVLGVGLLGGVGALLVQTYMNVWDYPVIIGGKDMFSWPAFVPIIFELFVLSAGFTIFGCLFAFGGFGKWAHPLHDADLMKRVTCDEFAVVLDAKDEMFNEENAKGLLERAGCFDVQPLHEKNECTESSAGGDE
ncbi:MAG: DUF3341 domain-containing protein [Planctomycetes bacterium]|nr:DUF3341 domain-containing protein [Planctomycetota bacterium]